MYVPAQCMLHNRTVFLNTRAGEGQALTFELGIQNDGAHLLPTHLYAVFQRQWHYPRTKRACRMCTNMRAVVTDGLEAAIADMRLGGQRLAVVPPELGYGARGQNMPLASVIKNATLYYEIELLRCEQLDSAVTICCDEEHFPCTEQHDDIDDDDADGETQTQPLAA